MKFIYKLSKFFKTEKTQKLFFIGLICMLFTLTGLFCNYIRITVEPQAIDKIIISTLVFCSAFYLVGYIISINAFDWYYRQENINQF